MFFFFNDTATTEIYTLSLHDALPISTVNVSTGRSVAAAIIATMSPLSTPQDRKAPTGTSLDRKSTRLNSSHLVISYAVFCLKKKSRHGGTRSGSQVRAFHRQGVGGRR